MNRTASIIVALLTIPVFVLADHHDEFRLSTAVARKVNADSKDQYYTEFGDANGPFKSIGGAVANSSGVDYFSANLGDRYSQLLPGIHDSNTILHVEFFVNKKGHGFGVVHKRPVEDAGQVEEKELVDNRPGDHIELSTAAKFAIVKGNSVLLLALLQAGLAIDEPLDLETQWTPLHYSAVQNQPRIAKLLIDNGAYLGARSKYGKRAIDYAFENEAEDLCEILKKANEKDDIVGGYPKLLLEELFFTEHQMDKKIKFISLNGEDPSENTLGFFRRYWPNVRPRSRCEEVKSAVAEKAGAKTSYRDKETNDYGIVVEISIKPSGEDTFEWIHREASGPFLAGGGSRGKVSKKFGYWISYDTQGWDE